jgi:predicted ester cyclase
MLRQAFPDGGVTIEEVIAEEDKVAVRFTYRGTHQGELMGIAPTGTQVTVSGMDINRIVEGKIAERWAVFDMLGILQQLGVVPTSGQGGR